MTLDALTAFFDLILPPAGHKCLFVLPDKRHLWFTDHRAMAEAALRFDQEGKTVYHGNAAFSVRKRKADCVEGLRAFRLDLDAGAGKPYASAGLAYGALQEWLAHHSLPAPWVLGSGSGIHAYWPLRDPLVAAEWGAAAHRLQSLCAHPAHGLLVDSTTTCDAARILRPPFTHNRKGPPVLVRLGPRVPAYDCEQLAVLFSSVGSSPRDETLRFQEALHAVKPAGDDALQSLRFLGPHDRSVLHGSDNGFTNIQAAEPDPDVASIVRECAQMRLGGGEPPSGWYAVVGVLANCGETGRVYARGLATAPEWVPVIEQKLDQWRRKTSGPTTCHRFRELNARGCEGCAHAGRITSPIQLGRPLPPALTAPEPPKLELPLLPEPYFWRGMRLAVTDQTGKDGAPPYHLICDYPLVIAELQEGERSGGVSAICRSWEPMKLAWREFVVNLKDALGDRGAGALAHHAVAIDKRRWGYMASYLAAMVNHYRGTKRYGIRYEQFGWKSVDGQPAFVVGTDLLPSSGPPARCFGSPELERRASFLSTQGSLALWRQAVEKTTLRPGMEPHTFQGLCGFASILYHLTGAEGGTIVHAVTMASGKGKTFGLKIAGSVWGQWFGLRIKARDTEVAKFVAIGVLGHLPVLYDELREVGPDAADKIKGFVLQYTLGEDKARGAADGGLRNDALPWSNIMLATANVSLADTCLSDGAETAQASRIYEFTPPNLPPDITTSYGDALEAVMAANAGHAGRAFAQAVMARWDWVVAAVPKAVAMWEQRLGGGPELRYTLRLLAVVSVTMAVLQQADILSVDAPALTAWMDATARENASRLAVEREVDPPGILSRMLNDLWPNTLVMAGPVPRGTAVGGSHPPVRIPNGKLQARYEMLGRTYLVSIDAVKRWMSDHRIPVTEIGKQLAAEGIVRRTRKTLGAGWIRSSQVWCWEVDGTHPAIAELFTEADLSATPTPENVVAFPGGKV